MNMPVKLATEGPRLEEEDAQILDMLDRANLSPAVAMFVM